LVKLPQVRQRHVQRPHRFRLFRQVQRQRRRCRSGGPVTHALQDAFDVVADFGPTLLDGPLHRLGRLLRQQLYDADVVLDAAPRPVLFLQVGTQFGKPGRQLPATEDVGVVQCGGLAVQGFQVVLRIETLLVLPIRTRMPGDHLAVGHHRDVVHVALDRHRPKGCRPRRAVAVVVEADRLVFVHLGRLKDAGIEREGRN
jgi:hypothetical protein